MGGSIQVIDYNNLLEKALIIIVEKNYATKYLLRKSLSIDDSTAEEIISRLELQGFVSATDTLLRRHVQQKAFDYVRVKTETTDSPHNSSQKQSNYNNSKNIKNSRKTSYDVLGIKLGASKNEIDDAYKKMAKMYHPDKVANLAPEYMEIAERRMKEINAAYQELKHV